MRIQKEDQETFIDTSRHLLPSAREGENTAREGNTTGRKSTRARRLSVIDEFSLPNLAEPRTYVSRRGKVYDDSDSEGENDPNNPRFLDTGVIKYRDTLGKVYQIEPNARFVRYKNAFTNLLKQICVVTQHPIISLTITKDSSRAITVERVNDYLSHICMYELNDYSLSFDEQIGGDPEQYIKVKRVEQNRAGTKFACAYLDDGKFRLRVFGTEKRDANQIRLSEVKINEMFGLNDYTMPNEAFSDPFITCCFIKEDQIFVNFYHSHSMTHYHFIWDIKYKCVIGSRHFNEEGKRMADRPISQVLESNLKNFPMRCFYNNLKNRVYSFYR